MYKREIKLAYKGLLIWMGTFLALFSLIFAIYPSIMTSENIDSINQLLAVFPENVLKAFNMDLTSITTPAGWIQSEGSMFILLCGGIYSSMLGFRLLAKEREDGTIEYLAARPVSRNQIVCYKMLAGLTLMALFTIGLSLIVFSGLLLDNDLEFPFMLIFMAAPFLPNLVLFFLSMLMSLFMKNSIGISVGIVIIFYMLTTISSMSSSIEFIKYLSPFTLTENRVLIDTGTLNWFRIVLTAVISGVLSSTIFIVYSRRELL